jgi:hypothetical protein
VEEEARDGMAAEAAAAGRTRTVLRKAEKSERKTSPVAFQFLIVLLPYITVLILII